MKVKKYVFPTLQEAMDRIRVDLGKDAVIISTKKIKTGGFLGLFRKDQFEVIAAVDQDQSHSYVRSTKEDEEIRFHTAQQEILSLRNHSKGINDHKYQNPPSSYYEKDDREVLKEVKEMRAMVERLVQHNQNDQDPYPISFKKIAQHLRGQEVEEEVIAFLIEESLKGKDLSEIDEDQAYFLIKQQMIMLLQKRFSNPVNPNARLLHFIGPTGVGKTTTIAKLAAHFVLNQKKKIGFITTDTYRIAAIDQLRTYANILNAPLEVVYHAEELKNCIEKLIHNHLILMDTAGRNYRNPSYVEDISHYLTSQIPSETYLVLSLTSKYKDNATIIKRFSTVNIDKIIYTKADETETFGAILNIAYYYPMQLSFITNGQTVPDDFILANPERLSEMILGGVHIGI